MRGNSLRWLLICLPMLLGMRDPFQPPQLNCPGGASDTWRYAGMVSGEMPLGIVRDDNARWLRVRPGEPMPTGWQVVALNEKEIVIDTLAACEPQRRRWPREGTTPNEKRDIHAVNDLRSAAGG